MKQYLTLTFFLVALCLQAQVPSGYYDSAQGLTGYTLKTELNNIINNGHTAQDYGDLWTAYYSSDVDEYYEDDNTILDIYSENPTGNDSFNFTLGNDQCGNYADEGDCYNREHLMPQSWFNEASPMKTDIHHVFPTDGYVNGIRGHLPYGEVGSANYTSQNGSKRGNNVYNYSNAYNGTVFEPIDEFKGDVARAYFYMATRYEDIIASWEDENDGSINTLNATSDQVFEDWMLDMLLTWHENDPVSQKEIDRNNEAFQFQGNRNPYIDNPQWVENVWGSFLSVEDKEISLFNLYPNPSNGKVNIQIKNGESFRYSIFNTLGELVKKGKQSNNSSMLLNNFPSGLYFVQVTNESGISSTKKLIIK